MSGSVAKDVATPDADDLPSWISAELVEETAAVWQPFVEHELTAEDAITILLNVGRLADLVRSLKP